MERHGELMRTIIGEFYHVYNRLGFGYLEQHYVVAMERRLRLARLGVVREYAVNVYFDGEEIGYHRLDMIVQACVVIELKATPVLMPQARRQLFNYLRATNLEYGLVLNFGLEPKFQKLYLPNPTKGR